MAACITHNSQNTRQYSVIIAALLGRRRRRRRDRQTAIKKANHGCDLEKQTPLALWAIIGSASGRTVTSARFCDTRMVSKDYRVPQISKANSPTGHNLSLRMHACHSTPGCLKSTGLYGFRRGTMLTNKIATNFKKCHGGNQSRHTPPCEIPMGFHEIRGGRRNFGSKLFPTGRTKRSITPSSDGIVP